MKKRGLSLFMVLVLCLTLLPTAAFAEGEDTRMEIRCVMKPSSIQRSYDGTTDGSTIPIDLTFTDGTNEIAFKEGTDFSAVKTFDSADAGWHTVTVEITLIGEAAAKYKIKAGEETFTIGGYIDKATPELTVSLSKAACTVGEKLLPLLSVSGVQENAAVTYYYAPIKTGYLEFEGSEAVPAIDENTAISDPGTYYVYAKTGETKNYKEERSTTAELTVNEAVVEAASVTKPDGTVSGTYKTLPAALDAAQDGDTVKLLANHVTDTDALKKLGEDFTFEQYASIVPVVTKTLTLDLNNKTVDYLEVGFTETNEETQKKETLATGNLTVTGEAAYGRISNLMFMAGALDIRSGEIGGSGCAGLFCDANSGSVTVSNGTVYGLTVSEGASVTVNGGSNHAGEWVVASGATLNITDGTFDDVQFTHNGTIAISGGTFKSIKSYIAEALQPLMSLLAPGYAFYDTYNENTVKDGSKEDFLQNVTVKEHTHAMVNNKCACGLSCTHTNAEGASTIGKDGKCTACGTQFAAVIGEAYYTDVPSALDAATDGQTVKLLANEMLDSNTYVSKTLTLDLDGHSLGGFSLNVGGLTATGQDRTGNLTVIDSSRGNGAVGVAVRDGGTLVFNPGNDNTTLLQLEVYGGTVELYGGKILRRGLQLNNGITLGNLLPGNAGLAYYFGDTQLTLAEAASWTCDLVVKSCSHGGKNGFDKDAATCPYCGAPAVAKAALNNGDGSMLWRRFANLQTAIDADRAGGAELTLLTDVTGDYTIDGTQTTGLNLNDHSIKGTVTVKGTKGDFITTTLSNTQNTTTARIEKVVAFDGAELAGSKYPAEIDTLTLAEGATWKNILNDTALGYKVLNTDGTHQWYAPDDVKVSQLNNVIINRLPITSKNLAFKVNGTNVRGNKVERGTTVQLCASCNTNGATVEFSILKEGETTPITLSGNDVQYTTVGTGKTKFYVAEYTFNDVGSYTISFTATKDGYTVQSAEKKLIVTKPNLSNAQITFPNGNEAAFNYATSTSVPTFVVKYNGTELEKDVDFVITGGGSTHDVGPCTLTIKAKDNGNYTGSKSAKWTVRPLKVAASVGDIIKTYDGTTNLPKDTKITFKSADSYYTGATLRLAKGTDYEVLNAHYDSADASQEEKTISFTVKLKNKGYVFDNGTTQKDFTLNGAELNDKTFKINKAAIASDTQLYQTVFNDLAKTYEIDLNQVLDKILPEGGKYGDIRYGKPSVFMDYDYYPGGGATIGDGKLSLSIKKAASSTQGKKIGTVTVEVETTNYQTFTLTIHVTVRDRITPVKSADFKISATGIIYRQTLENSTLTVEGTMKDPNTGEDVKGTFAWTNKDFKPDASDSYEAEWTFTPAEDYEEYATATGKATVKVNKADPTFIAPTANTLTYTGSEQPLLTAGSTQDGTMKYRLGESGEFVDSIPNGKDAGTYTVCYKVMGDGNHNDTEVQFVSVTIDPLPISLLSVSSISKTYDGSADVTLTADKLTFFSKTAKATNIKLPDTALAFSDAQFTSKQENGSYLPSPEVGGGKALSFTMTLTSDNYVFEKTNYPKTDSSVFATDDVNRFTITKAAAPAAKAGELTITNGLHKTYSLDLSTLLPKLTAPCDYGTITYDKKVVTNLGVGSFITLVDGKTGELTLEANRSGTDEGQFGTITVTISTSNYQDILLTINVSAKNRLTPVLSGELTLTPAKITYGDPLSKIRITGTMKVDDTVVEGTFSWQQLGDTVLDASVLGHDMGWRFTPEDENAYTEATGIAMVKVDKAMQYGKLSMTGYAYGQTPSTPTLTDRTGDGNAPVTYKCTTANGSFDQGWDIQNPPALNAGTYRMFARIGQTSNYYEYDVGYCEFVVAKATPPYTKPTGLTAKYGQTLEDVTLPDGWSWMDSSESVGGASTAAKKFMAKFTPTDTDNYNVTENIELEVTVNKADQAALTIQGADSVFYGQTLTLTASGGSGTGAVTYRIDTALSTGEATIDPETGVLTPVKVGSVSVIAAKAGDNDYNDNTSAPFVLMIKPATPTGEPKYTAITTSGKTLKDAALTAEGSTLNPDDGKLEWVDDKGSVLPDDTRVEANTTYKWRFTPTDTNYTTLTGEVELYHRSSSGGGWYDSYYTIKATAGAGGSISPSGNVSVRAGRDQTFTITPDKGYAVANVKIDGKSIGAVKSYTFENVRRAHTIEVSFTRVNEFIDVPSGSYFYEAVMWAVENSVTTGVSASRFDPNGVCTRAQAVTFLWRAAGSPKPETRAMPFTDVPVGSYYYDAVLWAVENGITEGTSDTMFSPDATCSRAQIVTFLWRSEKSPASGTVAPFADVKSTAYYAGAVLWAVREDITKGTTNTTFSPGADCTRAQIVTFLWRCKK